MADPLPLDESGAYVCPTCKGRLDLQPQDLRCPACDRSYPLAGCIPDFLAPVMGQITEPLIQRINRADRGYLKTAAGLYEGRFWYPLVIRLYVGKDTTSMADLVQRVKAALNVEQGRVLDVACGSATFGRRVASPARAVDGIDISMAMLHKGAEYIRHF